MWSAARSETEAAVVAADAAPLESIDTLLDHVTLDRGEPDGVTVDRVTPDRPESEERSSEVGSWRTDDGDDEEVWP